MTMEAWKLAARRRNRLFQKERNRCSILLSLLRRRIPPAEYHGLMKTQVMVDELWRCRRCRPVLDDLWLEQVRLELDRVFDSLESGQFCRERLKRFLHLYRDFFLLG
jgi:hypothetical protein